MKMDNITIEVIGRFVWVTGDTKPHKEQLKGLKFQWHSTKSAWYLKPENYRRQSRKNYGLDEIRDMYGTSGTMNSTGAKAKDEAEQVRHIQPTSRKKRKDHRAHAAR